MSTLGGLRTVILDALDSLDVQSYDHVPPRLVPPAVVVIPGSPYLEAGDVFGTWTIRHTVAVVAGRGTNERVTEDVDELITRAVCALTEASIGVEQVSTLYSYEANGGQFLAADITTITTDYLEREEESP